jgi:C-terminal processing protease CtpA/Prc
LGVGYGEEVWTGAAQALGLAPGTLGVLTAAGGMSLETGLERAERRRTLGARLQVRAGSGFVVASVEPGGTAASAGLREGDRILSINGTPIGPSEVVATRYALDTYIASARSGAPIRFAIERDGVQEEARGQVRESRVRHVEVQEVPSAPSEALVVRASLFQPTQPVPSR